MRRPLAPRVLAVLAGLLSVAVLAAGASSAGRVPARAAPWDRCQTAIEAYSDYHGKLLGVMNSASTYRNTFVDVYNAVVEIYNAHGAVKSTTEATGQFKKWEREATKLRAAIRTAVKAARVFQTRRAACRASDVPTGCQAVFKELDAGYRALNASSSPLVSGTVGLRAQFLAVLAVADDRAAFKKALETVGKRHGALHAMNGAWVKQDHTVMQRYNAAIARCNDVL